MTFLKNLVTALCNFEKLQEQFLAIEFFRRLSVISRTAFRRNLDPQNRVRNLRQYYSSSSKYRRYILLGTSNTEITVQYKYLYSRTEVRTYKYFLTFYFC